MPEHPMFDFFILAARLLLGFVFLYAGYLNAKSENREWLLTHTALIFPRGASASLVKLAAFIGVAMMLLGGVAVVLGFATGIGSAVLAVFSILGYWQHRKEVELAVSLADGLASRLEPILTSSKASTEIREHVLNLRISAYSGQFSSGLKNWGLIGGLILLALVGSGDYGLDQWLQSFRPNSLVDLIVWPR